MASRAPPLARVVSRFLHRDAALDRDQIAPLQLLRGLAASGVVVEHLLERYVRRGAIAHDLPDFTTRLGQTGVATFFAISGFIMVYIALREDRRSPSGWSFLRNRFLRVAPLYYLTTLTIVAFGWLAQEVGARTTIAARLPNVSEFLLSFAFIPHRGVNGLIQPIYELGWTLHYEMFFYLLFAAGLAVLARRGAFLVLAVLGLLVAAGTGIDAPPDRVGVSVAAYVFTRPIMGYFAIGIVIALVRHRIGDRLPVLPMSVIAAVAVAALGIAVIDASRIVAMTAIAVAVTVTVLTTPTTTRRSEGFAAFSRAFGNASYSIYLTHSFVLGAFASATVSIVTRGMPALVAMAVLACAVCFGVGWLSWRLIELPIAEALRGRRPSKAELVAP
jgi:exopolysaccharide production protein ExoZ